MSDWQADQINRDRMQALAAQLMRSTRDHLRSGPIGKDRVFEALNALAAVTALVISGVDELGDGDTAEQFFQDALSRQREHSRRPC
jgi:hypothetical protein